MFVYLDDILIYLRPEEDLLPPSCSPVSSGELPFCWGRKVWLPCFLNRVHRQDPSGSSKGISSHFLAMSWDLEAIATLLGFCQHLSPFCQELQLCGSPAIYQCDLPVDLNSRAELWCPQIKVHLNLQMPDPERHFMAEVDTSNVWVGAVLSYHSKINCKLHTCVFILQSTI